MLTVINLLQGKTNVGAFGRQVSRETVYRAVTLVIAYLFTASIIVIALSVTENFPFDKIMFETFSAMSTVGLSTGITPALSVAGRYIITLAMFIGRLGPLALIIYVVRHQYTTEIDYPYENIRIG